MPLPENEDDWDKLDVMFTTAAGQVRRNKLSDFVNVNRNGKIAMKLDEGDHIVDVQICTEDDDVLLTTARGQCIRFCVTDVRVFKGRDSTGVRGITSGARATRSSPPRSCATSRRRPRSAPPICGCAAPWARAAETASADGSAEDRVDADEEAGAAAEASLPQERYVELSAARAGGPHPVAERLRQAHLGLRGPGHGRGGKGIVAMAVNDRNGPLVASFPVDPTDQIMLVTDGGQLIRCPVQGIRVAGRGTQGVIVFDTAEDEKVVSVERITDETEEEGDLPAAEEPTAGGVTAAAAAVAARICTAPRQSQH